jgi:hypothetical protein
VKAVFSSFVLSFDEPVAVDVTNLKRQSTMPPYCLRRNIPMESLWNDFEHVYDVIDIGQKSRKRLLEEGFRDSESKDHKPLKSF